MAKKAASKLFLLAIFRSPFNLWPGRKEEALKWLDCSLNKGNRFTLAYFGIDPLYDGIRSEPQFQAALRKLKLL